ncbi:hypothetical protein J3R30DRAFT_306591 [Lentinula aciculospora]|uniref:BZIP domain-containing protein n=1 Tax=Lentinula aciculospora TaxID=153920 RepID=A0A9W9A952_9AGAR|nr:hypothetical protein J3R30DRAFT_306591 [Lentinula aciculospora]
MLSLKDLENPQDSESQISFLKPNIDSELEHWQKLVFSFDMDGGDSNNHDSSSSSHNNNTDRRNARSRSHSVNQQGTNAPVCDSNVSQPPGPDIQHAILLAQLAAAGGLPQPPATHDPAYNALLLALLQAQNSQHAPPDFQSVMHPQLYGQQSSPFGSIPSQFQWPPAFSHQQQQNVPYNQSGMNTTGFHHLPPINTNIATGVVGNSSAGASTSPLTVSRATSPDSTDLADPTSTEDKRRRNTAASARFRIKKKQRNLNLERTVSDLTGRADDLEKEAADLRRENGWLKEIVMLKGSRFAGLDVSPQNLPKPPDNNASFWSPTNSGSSRSVASSSRKPKSPEPEDSDSGDDSVDSGGRRSKEENASSSKGKERQK